MSNDQLNDRLQRLNEELDRTQVSDAASQDKIRSLQSDIQTVLDPNVETQPHHYASLREQLTDALDHFEDSHAQLTLAIGEVLENLAAIGL